MAREHIDDLLDSGIRNAVRLLEANGEFFPFGIGMGPDGGIAIVYPNMGDEHPTSDQVIQETIRALSDAAKNGEYITTGVVSDVRLRDRASGECKDAIRVDLEDSESAPVTCYLLYSRDGSQIKPGALQAEAGKSVVFRGRR